MIYLLLCIISSTSILIVFKLLDRYNISSVNAIVINYFTAAILGILVGGVSDFRPLESPWMIMAMLVGFFFVFMFYVIGYSTRVTGITVTSLTTKLSVVIPVLFSIIRFREEVTFLKVTGMIMALAAIVMIVYRPHDRKAGIREMILLPAVLFLGAGFIDSLIKYSQEVYVGSDETLAFSTFTFMFAAVTSVVFRLTGKFKKQRVPWYILLTGGVTLGLVNFGSLYFIVKALDSDDIAGSVVFGINHIGIVMLSALTGIIFFSERLSALNKAGIFVAIISIITLFYA